MKKLVTLLAFITVIGLASCVEEIIPKKVDDRVTEETPKNKTDTDSDDTYPPAFPR